MKIINLFMQTINVPNTDSTILSEGETTEMSLR